MMKGLWSIRLKVPHPSLSPHSFQWDAFGVNGEVRGQDTLERTCLAYVAWVLGNSAVAMGEDPGPSVGRLGALCVNHNHALAQHFISGLVTIYLRLKTSSWDLAMHDTTSGLSEHLVTSECSIPDTCLHGYTE